MYQRDLRYCYPSRVRLLRFVYFWLGFEVVSRCGLASDILCCEVCTAGRSNGLVLPSQGDAWSHLEEYPPCCLLARDQSKHGVQFEVVGIKTCAAAPV